VSSKPIYFYFCFSGPKIVPFATKSSKWLVATTETTEFDMAESAEEILYEATPAMFRNHPFYFVLCILLCFVVIGFVLLLVWWIQNQATRLTVTNEQTTLRRGILSKHTNDVFHSNVRNIQVRQSFIQRIFDVGWIGISSAGQAGLEIEVDGMPHPEKVKQIIDDHRVDSVT
jgi:uncharacterized membrane protein YdbT with pleckstrin-like domain